MTDQPSAGCQRRLLDMSRLLEGDLTPARRDALERHLAACTCCARLERSLRRAIARARASRVGAVPADVRNRARARVRALLAGDAG
jgi:anti-sigma factor RsiW